MDLAYFIELMLFFLSYDANLEERCECPLYYFLSFPPDSKHQKLLKGNNSATFITWSTDTGCLRINTD